MMTKIQLSLKLPTLFLGLLLTLSTPGLAQSTTSSTSSHSWGPGARKLYVKAGMSPNGKFHFNDARVLADLSILPATATLTYEETPSFELGFMDAREPGWGYFVAMAYDMTRTITAGEITDGNQTGKLVGYAGKPTLGLLLPQAGLVYRWRELYMPVGLNYSIVSYTAPSDFPGSVEAAGGLGYTFGLGYQLLPGLAIEASLRQVALQVIMRFREANAYLDSGSASAYAFSLKYSL